MLDKKTILVVEDEMPLQSAIKAKLESRNYHVVTARTVEQAIDYLDNLKDIVAVWLDHYLLGKKDGLDLMGELKKDQSKYKTVPVFIVSNTASEDKVRTYLELGAQEYLVKSNEKLDEIVNRINSFLEKK